VFAFDAATGKELWAASVTGKVHGLAVANGRLFVSTDLGTIHCFRAATPK
jgi:outer membrane protein assembly factor BamB